MNIIEQIQQLELDTTSAQQWGARGEIEAWVHKYLLSGLGGSSNPQFSEGLKRERRWWNGPLELALSDLSPAVGTTPGLEYVVEEDYWQVRTSKLAETFTTPASLPPLILEYRGGELSIRDGNTRYGAMQRLGWKTCWVVVWYNSEADYLSHSKNLSL